MLVASFRMLDSKDFNTLIMKCKREGKQYRTNVVRQHIVKVEVFNPNPIAIGKWIERFGYSEVLNLEIKSI